MHGNGFPPPAAKLASPVNTRDPVWVMLPFAAAVLTVRPPEPMLTVPKVRLAALTRLTVPAPVVVRFTGPVNWLADPSVMLALPV